MIWEVVLLLKGTGSFAESFTCNQNDIGSIFVRLNTLSKETDYQIRSLKDKTNRRIDQLKATMDTIKENTEKINKILELDECASNPCVNNATCVDGINRYSCRCLPGYNGTNSQIETNECDRNPCMNNATCVDEINRYSCRCLPGYYGTNCQIETNECTSNPCVNNATCVDGINRYSCRCLPGYEGTNCQIEINECASNPCVNNGTCLDGINRFSCRCMPGYNGTNCQNECKNPSSSLYCNCVDECKGAIDEAICECENGYSNEFVTIPGKAIDGWNILDQIVSSAAECQKLCINTEGCRSCELHKPSNRCWINHESPITQSRAYVDDPY